MIRAMPAAPPLPTPVFDPAAAYPVVGQLRAAMAARDWSAVRLICAVPDPAARSRLVRIAGDLPDVGDFLRYVLAADPPDTLAASMLGGHLVGVAWTVRTAKRAQYVSREQFATFHRILAEAEQVLIDAAARDPAEPSVWVNRLISARGLELGLSEVRRRYDRLAELDPHHLPGQTQLLQSLCPKWSGSWPQLHGFARQSMLASPPGSLNAVLVVEGHIEHWLDLDAGEDLRYLQSAEVREEIYEAAHRSVWHPAFRRTFGWVAVQNSFAMVFSLLGDEPAAASQFAALGQFGTEHPWGYLGDPVGEFVQRRARAFAAGGRR